MAKSNKLSKKAKVLLRTDVLVSTVLASVALNIYFFSGLYLFGNTNTLDTEAYRVAYSNLCVKNYAENLVERVEEADDPALAKLQFEAMCNRGDFVNYFQNAYEAYRSDKL